MKILKKCPICGNPFVASKISSKYCSRKCERVAFRQREAEKKKIAKENETPAIPSELETKQFLTPKNVQDLLGVSRATVYRFFELGVIKAVRMRHRTLVRRSDIGTFFNEASPYKKRSNKKNK